MAVGRYKCLAIVIVHWRCQHKWPRLEINPSCTVADKGQGHFKGGSGWGWGGEEVRGDGSQWQQCMRGSYPLFLGLTPLCLFLDLHQQKNWHGQRRPTDDQRVYKEVSKYFSQAILLSPPQQAVQCSSSAVALCIIGG